MKRLFALVSILLIFNLPFSCNPCGKSTPQKSIIVSIGSEIGSYEDDIFNLTNSNDYLNVAISTRINEIKYFNLSILRHNFSFVSAVYACSPVWPQPQFLKQIEIVSDESIFFNGIEYQQNENLIDFFKIQEMEELGISEYIEFQKSNPFIFAYDSDNIIFQLAMQPDTPISHKFTFTFTFDDGLEYQTLTPLFTVD